MSATHGKSDRLAAALRANLARRKAQARARRAEDESQSATVTSSLAGADVTDPAPAEHKERIVPKGEAG